RSLALREGAWRGHARSQPMAVACRMRILVLNAGSSSLKYHLFDCTQDGEQVLGKGIVERISSVGDALQDVFAKVDRASIEAVGHRVVHGGDRFQKSVIIDEEVEKEIDSLGVLAPLHNPHNIEAYRAV